MSMIIRKNDEEEKNIVSKLQYRGLSPQRFLEFLIRHLKLQPCRHYLIIEKSNAKQSHHHPHIHH